MQQTSTAMLTNRKVLTAVKRQYRASIVAAQQSANEILDATFSICRGQEWVNRQYEREPIGGCYLIEQIDYGLGSTLPGTPLIRLRFRNDKFNSYVTVFYNELLRDFEATGRRIL